MFSFLELFIGTVIHRPYVFVFFACFLLFSLKHLGIKGTCIYAPIAVMVAFLCEYSSTRNGFPFGIYTYIDKTRVRELWISNVPFWDSLSFVFLSYFSWILSAFALSPWRPQDELMRGRTAFLAGLLMMLLDVVIDPVTLQGEKWFLGQVYFYPDGGAHFGVPLSNYAGWYFVGTSIVLISQRALTRVHLRPLKPSLGWGSLAVYMGIFTFNLAVTAWIGRWDIFASSAGVVFVTLLSLLWATTRRQRVRAPRLEGITAT